MMKILPIITGILFIMLMVGGVAGVEAQDVIYSEITSPSNQGTTNVLLSLTQSYVVHIPQTVSLDDHEVVTGYTVYVSDLIIPSSKKLGVDVHSDNSWTVVLDEEEHTEITDPTKRRISYDMDFSGYLSGTCDSSSGNNPTRILEARMNTANTPVSLTFDLIGDIHLMGNYEDQLTFTVGLHNLN